MSIRNLDSLFEPASVAVIGASARAGSVGATVWHNLCHGEFSGAVFAVNPKHALLDGVNVFPSVQALSSVPELAVICTPPETVAGLIAELGILAVEEEHADDLADLLQVIPTRTEPAQKTPSLSSISPK